MWTTTGTCAKFYTVNLGRQIQCHTHPTFERNGLNTLTTTTMAEHAQQIVEAHTLDANGWCRCGLAPTMTDAEHRWHIRLMLDDMQAHHAERIAERYVGAFMGDHESATVYRERLVEMSKNLVLAGMEAVL